MNMNNVFKTPDLHNKKVVIWGAGRCGEGLYFRLLQKYRCEVIAYIDSKKEKQGTLLNGVEITAPENLQNYKYDYIIIGTSLPVPFAEINQKLSCMGISQDIILDISLPAYMELMETNRTAFIRGMARFIKENGIKGEVAECGVFMAETARFINAYFPDRKLYLFDTFEGFDERDINAEINIGEKAFIEGEFFSNPHASKSAGITADFIMKKMSYPENVRIYKGYFPESAEGVDERFCFVNLDTDLYAPILSGIEFFYPKMEKGGVILIHDYYNPELPGVKKALEDFEKNDHRSFAKIPIGDNSSIALIIT